MTIRVYTLTCIYIYVYYTRNPNDPCFHWKGAFFWRVFPGIYIYMNKYIYVYVYIYIYMCVYIPKCSMYGIFTYSYLGKYAIHWASGICTLSMKLSIVDPSHPPNISSNRIQATIHRHQPVHWSESIWFHRGGSTGAVPGDPLRKTQWIHPWKLTWLAGKFQPFESMYLLLKMGDFPMSC